MREAKLWRSGTILVPQDSAAGVALASEDLDPQHFDDDSDSGYPFAPKSMPEVHDLVYRTPGASTPKPEFNDLVHRSNGYPEEAGDPHSGYFQNAAAAQEATVQQTAAKAGAQQQGTPPAQSRPSAIPANKMPSNPQTSSQDQDAGPVINAADAQQTSGTKPESAKADETPSGME